MPQSSQDLGYGQGGAEAFSEAKSSLAGWPGKKAGCTYRVHSLLPTPPPSLLYGFGFMYLAGAWGLSLTSPESLKEGVGGKDLLPLRKGSWDPD